MEFDENVKITNYFVIENVYNIFKLQNKFVIIHVLTKLHQNLKFKYKKNSVK